MAEDVAALVTGVQDVHSELRINQMQHQGQQAQAAQQQQSVH